MHYINTFSNLQAGKKDSPIVLARSHTFAYVRPVQYGTADSGVFYYKIFGKELGSSSGGGVALTNNSLGGCDKRVYVRDMQRYVPSVMDWLLFYGRYTSKTPVCGVALFILIFGFASLIFTLLYYSPCCFFPAHFFLTFHLLTFSFSRFPSLSFLLLFSLLSLPFLPLLSLFSPSFLPLTQSL
jgi:hypothetical protein